MRRADFLSARPGQEYCFTDQLVPTGSSLLATRAVNLQGSRGEVKVSLHGAPSVPDAGESPGSGITIPNHRRL
jgi:hypothetical protein